MIREVFEKKFWQIWNRDLTEQDKNHPQRTGPIIPKKTPRQHPLEFLNYLWIVSQNTNNPVVLEIGKGHGQTEKFYRELLGAKDYISVDWKPGFNPTVCGDSTLVATINKVADALDKYDGNCDILFIDGDHNEMSVRCDLANYGAMVRPGGYVGFHDVCRRYSKTGAAKIWNEIKTLYEHYWDIHYEIDWLPKQTENGVKYEQIGIGLIKKSS